MDKPRNAKPMKYTLRQKFSIIICVKEGKNIWLELNTVNKYFDTIVPTQLFLFYVMVTVETIRTFTDSKSAVS